MDLDDELHQLFTTADDRLDVAVKVGAEEMIVAGARRVRRRRVIAATSAGAVGVVVAVVVGIALAGGKPDAMPPATDLPTTTHPAVPPAQSTTQVTMTSANAAAGTDPANTSTRTKPKSTPPKSTDPGPPNLNYQVLGPNGLRALALGQTLAEAQATGLIGTKTSDGGADGCSIYTLVGDDRVSGQVYISTTVQIIDADPVQTPEGVGPGWTIAQVGAVYPGFGTTSAEDVGSARVPGNAAALYRFEFVDGKVTKVSLQLTDPGCPAG